MPNELSKSKQYFLPLAIIVLIQIFAIVIGIGMTYYYYSQRYRPGFDQEPDFRYMVRLGIYAPTFVLQSLPYLTFVLVALVLIVVGLVKRVRLLWIAGALLPALLWLFLTWASMRASF